MWLGAALIHALACGMCRIAVLQLTVLSAAESARASRRQQAAPPALAESPAPVFLLNSGENHSLGSLATPWRRAQLPLFYGFQRA